MAYQKAYERIYWKNRPSDETPLNERNLNKMDAAVDEIDDRTIRIDTIKFDKTEAAGLIKTFEIDRATGVIKVTYYNGSIVTFDTLLEKIAVNFDFDAQTQRLVITLDDGTVKYIDISELITQYEFVDSETIAWEVDKDGKVHAIVKEGSIEEKHLRPNYLADVKVEVAKAEKASKAAEESELASKSYAVGGTGTRDGEDTDNAKYYAEKAEQGAAHSGWLSFKINDVGCLIMTKRNVNEIDFALNDGKLEVTFFG